MNIHIVTHAYAELLPQYAMFLRYQLTSLASYKRSEQTNIAVTVCYTPSDIEVVRVLHDFANTVSVADLVINSLPLPRHFLGRRSIGRNLAAINSKGYDYVWFTDVDHIFLPGCLDLIPLRFEECKRRQSDTVMIYPKVIQICSTHELGDLYCKTTEARPTIRPEDFINKSYNRAIGGVQIVEGYFAREHGYLMRHEGYQKPLSESDPLFSDFGDDVAYRNYCYSLDKSIHGVDLPGVYRLRHTRTSYQ